MKPINENRNGRFGFTIIELLTVMSIIVILMSLLAPALNRVRRYATDVKQRAQLHAIAIGLDAFNSEFDGYPDSNAVDDQENNYGGAMRLAEAMVGQDLKGFNPTSHFENRGFMGTVTTAGWQDPSGYVMPYPPINYPTQGAYYDSLRSRKMYLELEHANAYMLKDIYDNSALTSAVASGTGAPTATGFDPNTYVLCDSYNRVTNKTTGRKIGMPILYYRADTAKLQFPPNTTPPSPDMQQNAYLYTYNFYDNQALINMGMPWLPGTGPTTNNTHRLASGGTTPEGFQIIGANACPEEFYRIIRDPKISSGDRPYRADSYILMSAGYDGEYGTSDDIYNFGD